MTIDIVLLQYNTACRDNYIILVKLRVMKRKFKVLSLFSSAGVAEFGFDQDRFDIVLANELLKYRADTHIAWHPNTEMICGDITDDKIKSEIINESKRKKVDFILSTPPCQGVSLIGKNKNNIQMLKDKRNYLIFHTFDIIDEIKPKIVLIENVARFFKIKYPINNSYVSVEEIIRNKYSNDYVIYCDIFDAANYGVPQHRERAIIRMFNKKYSWDNPKKCKKIITVKDAIGDLPSLESGETSNIKNHYARKHSKDNILWMKHTPSGKSATENKKYYPKRKNGDRINCYSASYKRMEWDKPAPTITMRNDCIASQSNVHPGRKLKDGTYSDARVLTPRELFILSSINPDIDIPECVSDIQLRHIIGEAVPPKLISSILNGLYEVKK